MADSQTPRMIVIAGPPGSGKSTAFPVASFGVDCFNADDRAAELNGGSYLRISRRVRDQVNREFEAFILDHISARKSMAFETTLRSSILFDQTQAAKQRGFTVEMRYLALDRFESNVERFKLRADRWPQCAGVGPPRDLCGKHRQPSPFDSRVGKRQSL